MWVCDKKECQRIEFKVSQKGVKGVKMSYRRLRLRELKTIDWEPLLISPKGRRSEERRSEERRVMSAEL